MNPKRTSIRLMGGLGNQLFIYSFGLHLELVHGHTVTFHMSKRPRWGTNHGVSLSGRGLNVRVRDSTWFDDLPLRGSLPGWGRVRHFQESGFSESACEVPRGGKVVGYFQSWRYASALIKLGVLPEQTLLRKPPSEWFVEKLSSVDIENPVVIHARRGDYRQFPNLMGLVGADYYKQAVEHLGEQIKNSPIWVFSDEPDWAADFFGRFLDDPLIMRPPSFSDPAESLVLMSLGKAHIISNSSFSWWGAFLSDTTTRVIAPDPWLNGYSSPHDLIPNDWHTIGHTWTANTN